MFSCQEENTVVIHDACNDAWLLFSEPVRIIETMQQDTVMQVLQEVEEAVNGEGMFAAGFVSYDAAPAFDPALVVRKGSNMPLVWFGIYRKPEPVERPEASCPEKIPLHWDPSISRDEYSRAVLEIKDHLRQGDSYQVNYTFRMRASLPGQPWDLFVQMLKAQDGRYGAFINTRGWAVCSASPELFFQLNGRELVCRPMKGTAGRGLWHEDDLRAAARLAHCEKNRAENLIIVDMVRNDMGRISEAGSVNVPSIFDVEKFPAMWQLTSTVSSRTDESLPGIFRALFPPASITGAPKARTMEIISRLEDSPRKIYTGSIGFVSPGKKAQFNVAIRTVLADRKTGIAEYGVGGGIVWDSVESAEFDECRTKASVLTYSRPEFSLLETMKWDKGSYLLLEKHLERLSESAAYFDRKLDQDLIRDKLAYLSRYMIAKPHLVRLIVPPAAEPVIETRILPSRHRKNVRICLAKTPVDPGNPFLYHKTTFREIYELALSEASGFDDVLLWNMEGEITESCRANIVVEMGGRLLTPPVTSGLLPGTYRSHLLDRGEIHEQVIRMKDLNRCSKIYLINSVRGMREVRLERQEPEYRLNARSAY